MAKKKYPEYCSVYTHVLEQHLKYLNAFNYTVCSLIELTSTMIPCSTYMRKSRKEQNSFPCRILSALEKCLLSNAEEIYWFWCVFMKLNYCNNSDKHLPVEVLFHIYWALSPELGQAPLCLPTLKHRVSYPFLSPYVAAFWNLITSQWLSFRSRDFCVFHSSDRVQMMLLNHRLQFSVEYNTV